MIRLDERGKQCPLPVIEAKRVLEAAAPGEAAENMQRLLQPVRE